MPLFKQKIAPCLWYDTQAEDAAKLYTSLFPNSKILDVSRYGDEGHDVHGRPKDTVMTVAFELENMPFLALNGGPAFTFTEAISLQIYCDDQAEVDHYWNGLTANGGHESQCGWLKDRFGLSWQVTPKRLIEMVTAKDYAAQQRAMKAMMQMQKFDIAALERAFAG